jgi:hypothetical protein
MSACMLLEGAHPLIAVGPGTDLAAAGPRPGSAEVSVGKLDCKNIMDAMNTSPSLLDDG